MGDKGGKGQMNNKVKENTLVKRMSPAGTECIGRVRWVNEKGQAGITYNFPDSYKGSAQVVDVEELEVIQNNIEGDLKDVPTKDLIAAIKRLRGMRLPKKPTTRGLRTRKTSIKSKLDALFAEGGNVLDELIQKAMSEIKEEERK